MTDPGVSLAGTHLWAAAWRIELVAMKGWTRQVTKAGAIAAQLAGLQGSVVMVYVMSAPLVRWNPLLPEARTGGSSVRQNLARSWAGAVVGFDEMAMSALLPVSDVVVVAQEY